MKNNKNILQRLIAMGLSLVMIVGMIPSSIASASNGSHTSTNGSGYDVNSGNSNSGGNSSFVLTSEGLTKLSFVIMEKNKYLPVVEEGASSGDDTLGGSSSSSTVDPLMANITPISVSGTNFPSENYLKKEENQGRIGVAPIYFGKSTSTTNELGVKYSGGKFVLNKIKNNIDTITTSDVQKAYNKAKKLFNPLSGVTVSEIEKAFVIGDNWNVLKSFDDNMSKLKMVTIESNPNDVEQKYRDNNKFILTVILELMKAKYKGNDKIVDLLDTYGTQVIQGENPDYEFMILVEPMQVSKLGNDTRYAISSVAYQIGCVYKAGYTGEGEDCRDFADEMANFRSFRTGAKASKYYNDKTRIANGLGGYGYYIGNIASYGSNKYPNGQVESTAAVKKAQCLSSIMTYTGFQNYDEGSKGYRRAKPFVYGSDRSAFVDNESYKWGWGALTSRDSLGDGGYKESVSVNTSSLSLIAGGTNYNGNVVNPVINLGYSTATAKDAEDLNAQIRVFLETLEALYKTNQITSNDKDVKKVAQSMFKHFKIVSAKDTLGVDEGTRGQDEIAEDILGVGSETDSETESEVESETANEATGENGTDKADSDKEYEDLGDDTKKSMERLAGLLMSKLKANDKGEFVSEENIQLAKYMYIYYTTENTSISGNSGLATSLIEKVMRGETLTRYLIIGGTKAVENKSVTGVLEARLEYESGDRFILNNTQEIDLARDSSGVTTGITVSSNKRSLEEFNKVAREAVNKIQANVYTEYNKDNNYGAVNEYGTEVKTEIDKDINFGLKPLFNYTGTLKISGLKNIVYSKTGAVAFEEFKKDSEDAGSVTIPKTGIDKMSQELQALITDYIGDITAYVGSVGKTEKKEVIEEKMLKELQMRVLMYMDVVRDYSDKKEYQSYIESAKDGSRYYKAGYFSKDSLKGDGTKVDYGDDIGVFDKGKEGSILSMTSCNTFSNSIGETDNYKLMPDYIVSLENSTQGVLLKLGSKSNAEKMMSALENKVGKIVKEEEVFSLTGEDSAVVKKKSGDSVVYYLSISALTDAVSGSKAATKTANVRKVWEAVRLVVMYEDSSAGVKNSVITRMKKLSNENGTGYIVDALLNGIGGISAESGYEEIYSVMGLLDDTEDKTLSYGEKTNDGIQYTLKVDSVAIARLVECVILASSYSKRDSGVLVASNGLSDTSYGAYYYTGGITNTLWENPFSAKSVGDIDITNTSSMSNNSNVYEILGDSYDTRLSIYNNMYIDGDDSNALDALLTTNVNDTLGSAIDVVEKSGNNSTFLRQTLEGDYNIGGVGVGIAIPVDMVIMERNEYGKVKLVAKVNNVDTAINGMLNSYTLGDLNSKVGGEHNVKVEYVFMNSANNSGVIGKASFIHKVENIMTEMDASGESKREISDKLYTKVGETSSTYMQKCPLKYTYTDTSGQKRTIEDNFLYSLTSADMYNYYNKGMKAQIVVVVTRNSEIREIDVITDKNGTVLDVQQVEADVKGEVADKDKKVKLKNEVEYKDAAAVMKEWTVKEGLGEEKDINKWEDAKDGAKTEGVDIYVPIDWGETVYVRYEVEENERVSGSVGGEWTLNENEISKQVSLSSLKNTVDANGASISVPIKAAGYWVKTALYTGSHSVGTNIVEDENGNELELDITCIKSTAVSPYRAESIYTANLEKNEKNVVSKKSGFEMKTEGMEFKGTYKLNKLVENNTPKVSGVIWRGKDIPTIAGYVKQNSGNVQEMLTLGLSKGNEPVGTRSKIKVDTHKVNLVLTAKVTANPETYIDHSDTGCTDGSSKPVKYVASDLLNYDITVKVKNHIDSGATGDVQGDYSVKDLVLNGKRYNFATGKAISQEESIKFYPYVEMEYDTDSSENKKIYVLADGLSEIQNSDYVEVGWRRSENKYTLDMTSKQWSTHKRVTSVLGGSKALPGGAIYKVGQSSSKVYVGIRTWQTVLPSSLTNAVVGGGSYYSSGSAEKRRETLHSDVRSTLDNLELVQYVAEGIITDVKGVMNNGVEIKAVKGKSEKVFGQNTSTDSKYYLKRKTNTAGRHNSDDANLDLLSSSSSDKKSQVVYTIKSDVNGNVVVDRDGTVLGKISKNEGIRDLLEGNTELHELDDRTKLITNYMEVVDRNKGENNWYNEAWDGVSVVVTTYEIEVGLGDGASTRSSALDPKLIAPIESKSDIYNKDKYRSSVFVTGKKAQGKETKPERYLANWGDNNTLIGLPGMEMMFTTDVFYIPNATVQDLSR